MNKQITFNKEQTINMIQEVHQTIPKQLVKSKSRKRNVRVRVDNVRVDNVRVDNGELLTKRRKQTN